MASNYTSTIADEIIRILKASLRQSIFRSYFYGEPVQIGSSYLPCVTVTKTRTEIRHGATGMDKRRHFLTIRLIIDKRSELGAPPEEVTGQRTLENYAEGIDPATGEYSASSVLGILRRQFTLDNVVLNQDGDVDYEVLERTRDSFTTEAAISFVADENLIVSNRK